MRYRQAANSQLLAIAEEFAEFVSRDPKRHQDLVQFHVRETDIMDHGIHALRHRVGDHAVDFGVRVDTLVAIDVPHHLVADLAGGQFPLVMQRRVGERSPELAGQDPRRRPDLAHADPDRRHSGIADHPQHPHVIAGTMGQRRNLDDVRVQCRQTIANGVQVFRRVAEVVIADHPLRLAEPRNTARNIVLQIDIIHTFGHGRPQRQQAGFLRTLPLATILLAAARENARAGPLPQQPGHVQSTADIVRTQLDQLHTLLRQVAVFGDHMFMTTATDTDANHAVAPSRGKGGGDLRATASGAVSTTSTIPILLTKRGDFNFQVQVRLNRRSSSSRVKTSDVGRPCGQWCVSWYR